MNNKHVILNKECHSPKSLWGIFRVCNARKNKHPKGYAEDPRTLRAAFSGMTTYFNLSPLTLPSPSWRGNTNNPLPPGGGRCPVRADEGEQAFPARSVIPVLRTAENAEYSGRSGFTLIELLVVILIIGILAAIALPQYQKAVTRAKSAELFSIMDMLAKGAQNYLLVNGHLDTWDAMLTEFSPHIIKRVQVGTGSISHLGNYFQMGSNSTSKGMEEVFYCVQPNNGDNAYIHYYIDQTGKQTRVCSGDDCVKYINNVSCFATYNSCSSAASVKRSGCSF